MTPLVSYATNITPALAVANACFAAVVVPELEVAYDVPNGVVPQNFTYSGNGVRFPGPMFRAIRRASLQLEVGAGLTAGTLLLVGLRPDGNWHQIGTLTPAASTTYYHSLAAGLSAGQFTVNAGSIPLYGLAVMIGIAFVGGNINYLEIIAEAEAIDPGFVHGSKLGALIQ